MDFTKLPSLEQELYPNFIEFLSSEKPGMETRPAY